MTIASFNNIRKRIQDSIGKSKNKIIISVAWFTSKDLLGQLTDKFDEGCEVEIIISDHVENKRLSFKNFIDKGGKVFILQTKSGKFLHDKFAIFDNRSVIAGSYNWTNSAEFYNHEFVIQSVDAQLVKQFYIRFENLKKIVNDYDQKLLSSHAELTAETMEDEFIKLEGQLEIKFLETLKTANELGAKINSANVIAFIHKYGAIGGASRLIKSGTETLHSGLIKLWEINRLDISFESIILQEDYRILFEHEILEKAQQRLHTLKGTPKTNK